MFNEELSKVNSNVSNTSGNKKNIDRSLDNYRISFILHPKEVFYFKFDKIENESNESNYYSYSSSLDYATRFTDDYIENIIH